MHSIKTGLDFLLTVVLIVATAVIVWRGVGSEGADPPSPAPPPPTRTIVDRMEDGTTMEVVVDSYFLGSPHARVTVVEFSDLQCPFCARHAQQAFAALDREWVQDGQVSYVFRHFPLEHRHAAAVEAAHAADCSARQRMFWRARDALFDRQRDFGAVPWRELLTPVGLDLDAFDRCMTGDTAPSVAAHRGEGARLGVNSTPTFFVGVSDGIGIVRLSFKIRGAHSYEVFDGVLRDLLPAGLP